MRFSQKEFYQKKYGYKIFLDNRLGIPTLDKLFKYFNLTKIQFCITDKISAKILHKNVMLNYKTESITNLTKYGRCFFSFRKLKTVFKKTLNSLTKNDFC